MPLVALVDARDRALIETLMGRLFRPLPQPPTGQQINNAYPWGDPGGTDPRAVAWREARHRWRRWWAWQRRFRRALGAGEAAMRLRPLPPSRANPLPYIPEEEESA